MSVETAPAKLNPLACYIEAFKKYATFTGRATRAEYWWFMLVHVISYGALAGLTLGVNQDVFGFVTLGYLLAAIVPQLALTARRFHDAGYTGLWQFIGLVPLGGIVIFIFAVLPAKDPNKWGPNPREIA